LQAPRLSDRQTGGREVGKDGIIPSHSFSLDGLPDIRATFVYLKYDYNLVADCVWGTFLTGTSAAHVGDSVI